MDFQYIISSIILPLITTLITAVITVYLSEKAKRGKILFMYNKLNKNIGNSVIFGKYKKNIELEKEFKKYLQLQSYNISYYIKSLLHKTYINYSKKTYLSKCINQSNEEKEISDMINYFKDDYNFMYFIKIYDTYITNSNWTFKLVNSGSNQLYNLNVIVEDSIDKPVILKKDVICSNEVFEFNINYFDLRMRINSFNFGENIPFEFGYSKYVDNIFYMVNNFFYNKKDEILCKIVYSSSYGKKKRYYICYKERFRTHKII